MWIKFSPIRAGGKSGGNFLLVKISGYTVFDHMAKPNSVRPYYGIVIMRHGHNYYAIMHHYVNIWTDISCGVVIMDWHVLVCFLPISL